ncbi:MAG: hypothetical protein ACE5GH_01770 [Fidelibacterota bacterium]
MIGKRKKKKSLPEKRFKKSLRQSTHPIPPEKVEESGKGYRRSQFRKKTGDEIDREMEKE